MQLLGDWSALLDKPFMAIVCKDALYWYAAHDGKEPEKQLLPAEITWIVGIANISTTDGTSQEILRHIYHE